MENKELEARKIAIFTDAHALLEPTEAALEDMQRRGITEIYSLGDNIGVGPNPSENSLTRIPFAFASKKCPSS